MMKKYMCALLLITTSLSAENRFLAMLWSYIKTIYNRHDHHAGAVREMSAQELLARLNDPKLLIVNVLGKRYYDDARIKGSVSAPLRILADVAAKWEKDQEIVVYCACKECDASEKAFKLLQQLGFTNVWAYEGGIREWWKLNYPCEGPCAMQYLREEGDSRRINWDLD